MAFSQGNSVALAKADTTNFSPNLSGGWVLYNSYITPFGKDSIQFEIIVQHVNDVGWKNEFAVGKIKNNSLLPKKEKIVPFKILYNSWQLRIEANGRCWLSFLGGQPPLENPFIVPVKLNFRQ